MGGKSGGLLWLADKIGGIVLYILIGARAFVENDRATWIRLCFGSCVLGLISGLILLIIYWLRPFPLGEDKTSRYLIVFLAVPALFLVLIYILESIKKSLEKTRNRNE